MIVGAVIGVTALFGALMNWNYMMAGTASTNPMLFVIEIGRPAAGVARFGSGGRRLCHLQSQAAVKLDQRKALRENGGGPVNRFEQDHAVTSARSVLVSCVPGLIFYCVGWGRPCLMQIHAVSV
jgi:hypothetical protein